MEKAEAQRALRVSRLGAWPSPWLRQPSPSAGMSHHSRLQPQKARRSAGWTNASLSDLLRLPPRGSQLDGRPKGKTAAVHTGPSLATCSSDPVPTRLHPPCTPGAPTLPGLQRVPEALLPRAEARIYFPTQNPLFTEDPPPRAGESQSSARLEGRQCLQTASFTGITEP